MERVCSVRKVRSRQGKKGFFVHLPATKMLLAGASICLIVLDAFLAVADANSPAVTASWLAWSQPLTDFMAQFIPAIDGIGREMAYRGMAARIPLMRNLIACNWAILCVCYVASLFVILVEAGGKRETIAQDIKNAAISWVGTLDKTKSAAWIVLILVNVPLLTSWMYDRPYALYESDSQIPFVCFLFGGGIYFTPRWILLNVLLLRANSRRILSPQEPEGEPQESSDAW